MCVFLALLFLNNMFIFKATNRKSAFIESASFKSLFLVKFQVSSLDESQHLLVKLSCESACENLDAIIPRSALCFFPTNIAVEQDVIVAVICDCALFIYSTRASDVQCTTKHVQSK